MMNKWRQIWESRQPSQAAGSELENLLRDDGYDILGAVTESAWLSQVRRVASRLNLQPGGSIFDVGCGAGAFLWPLWKEGHPVGGLDYSPALIERARKAMPGSTNFQTGEALGLADEPAFDAVVACGTFLYFPDLDYAKEVLSRMARKARFAVALLDLPDLAKKDEILRRRRETLGEEVYRQRYEGLDHLYFSRTWVQATLEDLGFSCTLEEQKLEGYAHSSFRFNAFARKLKALPAPTLRLAGQTAA